ncbi:hypothetical protein F4809DRAFT_640229 [Biscogniauxia mediterranea]|nr:hypothetical protein F4809DRAFT_640229 [Biscogniauxia mediterranea]
MNTIFNMFNSPATARVNGDQPNGSPGLRGTKRKSKQDPYDIVDEDDEPQRTPVSQRNNNNKSRISSETPNSSTRGRVSAGKIKRRSRASLATATDSPVQASRVDAAANLARAKEPGAARLQPDPEDDSQKNALAPVADMGASGSLENKKTDATAASSNTDKAPAENDPKPASKPTPKGKGKAAAQSKPEAEPEPEPEAEAEAEAEGDRRADNDEDDREEHEIDSLLKHRMASDGSGAVEILVHWLGEKKEDATWELEEEIQRGAEESLYDYWKAQGGRLHALFIKPKNPPPEIYHVFKVLRHEKKPRGGFQFEVQWVGHPPTRGETSNETEAKLKKIAPELLEEYWESIGGREKHLAKRGRGGKRARTE